MVTESHSDADAGHGHDHPPYLAHHFDTPQQQFESGKLGMWVFLATEILLFAGLFCAYAVYRTNHPEIFDYAHKFLDARLGAINTVVLLFSSFTMAWAVRCAQTDRKELLVILLGITLLCGFGFLGIKFVEYKAKFEHGLLWGKHYQPHFDAEGHGEETHGSTAETAESHADEAVATEATDDESAPATDEDDPLASTPSEIALAADAPRGLAAPVEVDAHDAHAYPTEPGPDNVHIFFGIYFTMTGLHGVHVIVGMIVIGWLMFRSQRGDFSRAYYTPVDLGGLYWHLVDLIWIYLFPLLYLIH